MLPHRARDVLHGGTVDREQVVARDEAAKVRRAGRVDAPDDDLCRVRAMQPARAPVHISRHGAGYARVVELATSCGLVLATVLNHPRGRRETSYDASCRLARSKMGGCEGCACVHHLRRPVPRRVEPFAHGPVRLQLEAGRLQRAAPHLHLPRARLARKQAQHRDLFVHGGDGHTGGDRHHGLWLGVYSGCSPWWRSLRCTPSARHLSECGCWRCGGGDGVTFVQVVFSPPIAKLFQIDSAEQGMISCEQKSSAEFIRAIHTVPTKSKQSYRGG